MSRFQAVVVFAVLAWRVDCSAPMLWAEDPTFTERPTPDQIRFFENRVRPLLAEHCYKCHGPRMQKNGLRLDSREALLRGGDSGPAVVPGKAKASRLIEAINYDALEMPPDGKLSTAEIATLTQWVDMGVPWPATATNQRTTGRESPFTDEDRSFWSFQPVQEPILPAVDDQGWSRNPIDRFIFAKLNREGLTPGPPADRRTLIRRLYYDLIGLPPTPEEVDAFVANDSPAAYEDLVDRLLGSPQYGERWGRHWLDLVRYAESHGHGNDQYRPNAWQYRDYVVRSFNADKPYDQFIREQLAGDELGADNPDALIATGFLRHWTYESNQRLTREIREVILTDLTNVVGDVFLGLGLGCARCHDHKFDPILQADYYRMQSFFAALLPRDDIPVARRQEVEQFQAKQRRWEELTVDIRREIDELERPFQEAAVTRAFKMYPQEIKDIYRASPESRTPLELLLASLVQQQLDEAREGSTRRMDDPVRQRWNALNRRLAQYDADKPVPLPYAMVVADIGPIAPETSLPGRQAPIEPGYLSILNSESVQISPPPLAPTSTGRRTALADWIAAKENPLTARVLVNRVWQYHFGRGIVATASDFGALGELPTHPELLDWLAHQFAAEGWHFKSLHRLLLTSATYRQSALRPSFDMADRKDPGNAWLWRMNIRRLEAEPVRDSMLALSGELNLAMEGPSVETSEPRRTMYAKIIRNTPDPLLQTLDAPDGFISTPQRDQSTTASQALMLMNGEWTLGRAKALANRLKEELGAKARAEEFVGRAFQLCFGRGPESGELADAVSYMRRRTADEPGKVEDKAIADLCHVLLNANEFLYID